MSLAAGRGHLDIIYYLEPVISMAKVDRCDILLSAISWNQFELLTETELKFLNKD